MQDSFTVCMCDEIGMSMCICGHNMSVHVCVCVCVCVRVRVCAFVSACSRACVYVCDLYGV